MQHLEITEMLYLVLQIRHLQMVQKHGLGNKRKMSIEVKLVTTDCGYTL